MIVQRPVLPVRARGQVKIWDAARGIWIAQRPLVVARGHGLAGLGFPQLSTDYCASGWSLLNPLAWFGGCVGPDVAEVYQKVQYGTAPPAVVTPPAPTVSLTTNAATPGAVYAGTDTSGAPIYAVPETAAESQAVIVAKQNAAIDAAIAQGYNPYGNLPFNALDLSKIPSSTWLVGAALLAGLVLFGGRRGR